MRDYQFERMKYYYAIAEFDSIETATHIYEQCDRMEYESSGIHLDLRFVPEETKFDEDKLKERVDYQSINISKFKPSFFESGALRLKNPKISWDADDRERKQKLEKAKENPDDLSDFELVIFLLVS